MSLPRAVVHIDPHRAKVLLLDAEHVQTERIEAHEHYTRQHGSAVRTEHEFYGEVCDALADVARVVVVGSHSSQADFRHYVEKHRGTLFEQIVGWRTVDNPTEGQVVALGREYFVEHDNMALARARRRMRSGVGRGAP